MLVLFLTCSVALLQRQFQSIFWVLHSFSLSSASNSNGAQVNVCHLKMLKYRSTNFEISCSVICCSNNGIRYPFSCKASFFFFPPEAERLPCTSDLRRRWEYWCHIKHPLGNCALAVFTRFVWYYCLKISPWLHALLCLAHISCSLPSFPSLGI